MISSMFFPSNAANSESILSASGSQEPALRTSMHFSFVGVSPLKATRRYDAMCFIEKKSVIVH